MDIDTQSDIYALGVLLCELLTGVTSFDGETLRNAALDEIRRLIRETEPPKPSTRLQTLGKRLAEVAKHRQIEPAALSRLVREDLDWIAMKCQEKDRGRRYETANYVALDIKHHLSHEPVSAAAPSTVYRVGKFVRRHEAGPATWSEERAGVKPEIAAWAISPPRHRRGISLRTGIPASPNPTRKKTKKSNNTVDRIAAICVRSCRV